MLGIKEMAVHLRNNVAKSIPDDYPMAAELIGGLAEADARAGVRAFASAIERLFQRPARLFDCGWLQMGNKEYSK